MKNYYKIDEWSIIEEGFNPKMQKSSESIFSLGNGRMGQRANFEEKYTGKSLQGIYIAGVYYPDKTIVGWWKNGYPEYFAKVINAPNWIGIHVEADDEELDLHTCTVSDFRRELNMKQGYLERSFIAELPSGKKLKVDAKRFLSIADDEIGAIKYSVTPVNFDGKIKFTPFIDGDVRNKDANYDEKFWDTLETGAEEGFGYLVSKTKKTGFVICMTMRYEIETSGELKNKHVQTLQEDELTGNIVTVNVAKNETITLYKYVSVLNSMNYEPEVIAEAGKKAVNRAFDKKFDTLLAEHITTWAENWSHSDIIIKGDPSAQQGIRFNIFHLNQTYTGRDERLNIGPKGFTGEKYGGVTYWDTEAFLIPFYLSTASQLVARNLLIYRYKHLQKAIENGEKLGFHSGAALYPMVTINGEECHNEWEITFEEIHRNGAIAYAIFNYLRYTGDKNYLAEYGLEVLIAISRFWRQRVNWSDAKGKYVILGVTGPNEYENNVNNNWYTNKIAAWTLKYTLDAIDLVKENHPEDYTRITDKTSFDYKKETKVWKDIVENMYFPFHEEQQVFMQQDGYMDKEQLLTDDLDPLQRPINQYWSWDRILRSVFIKQADVLQGIYCFIDEYDTDTIRRNFEFYESRCVHESSLSPCIHSILANRIDEVEKAYELYLRTSRLDLDDYNKEVKEGLHITSMGGTWMSIVMGFGGMHIKDGKLSFNTNIPAKWEHLSFNVNFRNHLLRVDISRQEVKVTLVRGEELEVIINGKTFVVNK